MTGYTEQLARYASVLAPLAAQAPAAPVNSNVPSQQRAYQIGVAQDNGRALPGASEAENDLLRLSASQLLDKYGPAAGEMIAARVAGYNAAEGDRSGNRTLGDGLGDTLGAPVLGAINSVGSIAALGTGLVNARAGTALNNQLQKFTDWAHGTQSDVLQSHRRYNATLNQIDEGNSTLQYENDRQSQGDLVASLRRIGRDALNSVKNAVSDPIVAADGTAEGVGSLFTAGPEAKLAAMAGKGLISKLLGRGLLSETAALKASSVGSKLLMPGVIGSQEAGGTYQQTVQQVVGMSHDDLMKSSPDYADLIKQGMSPDDARNEIANSAGLRAAAIQFPAAALTGTLVSKFEVNPLKVSSLGHTAADMLRETVEEGIQSGSGQLAQNLGVRAFADQNQSLSEGVGQQAGLGALYGLGSAGVAQTPGTVGNALTGAGKLTVKAGKAAVGAAATAIDSKVGSLQAEREAASPVAPAVLSEQADQALAQAPEVRASLDPRNQSHFDQLTKAVAFDPAELEAYPLAPEVKDHIGTATNRVDAIQRAAEVAGSTEQPTENRIGAAIFINDTLNQSDLVKHVAQTMEPLADHEVTPELQHYDDVLYNMGTNPEVTKARQIAQTYVQNLTAKDVSEAAVQTPKGQQAVQGMVSVAQSNPELINPDIADIVLEHARAGRINLGPAQAKTLANAASINKIGHTYQIQAKKLDLKPMDIVGKQVLDEQSGTDVRSKSAAAHLQAVNTAMAANDLGTARASLRDMLLFAEHMQNKVEALNTALAENKVSETDRIKYKALTENRKWVQSPDGVWLNPKAKGSVILAQKVGLEARTVGEMANQLAAAYPELGLSPVKIAELDPRLLAGPAAKVVEHFRRGVPVAPVEKSAVQPMVEQPNKPVQPNTTPPVEAPSVEATVQPAQVEAKPEPSKAETSVAETPAPVEKPITQKENATPEPQKSADQVAAKSAEPAAKSTSELFPHLVQSDKVPNWLIRAFKVAKDVKSRVIGMGNPIEAVRSALGSNQEYQALVGKIDRTITPELGKAYTTYLNQGDRVTKAMSDRLAKFLANPVSTTGKGKTGSEQLLEGRDGTTQVNSFPQGRALNIVENIDGKLAYNAELQQGAVLAGLQWLVTASARTNNFNAEDVAGITGLDESQAGDHVDFFNDGHWLTEAKRNLADQIVKFWGLVPDRTAPENHVKGIAEGVAAEVIRALEAAKLVKDDSQDINGKTFHRLILDEGADAELLKQLQAFPDAIERAVRVEPEVTNHIGAPPSQVATHQLHGSLVELKPQQREAITAAQATPHLLNRHMLAFYQMLDKEGLVHLFGAGDPQTTGLNVNHAKAIDGFNRSLTTAFDGLSGLVAEMENKSQTDGSDLYQTPVHYEFGVTSVGRLQMIGKHNPQASKLVREALLPTWSKLDLTGDGHYRNFMLAVAQHLGEKVHKMLPDQAVTAAEDLVSGKFAPAVSLFQEWLASQEANENPILEPGDLDMLRSTLGDELTPGAVYALMEYARYLNADQTGKAAFETGLYLEADGVTDGPVNALMNLSAGEFTPDQLDRLNRGGLFLGSQPTSLGDYVAAAKANGEDLYQLATNLLRGKLNELMDKVRGDPEARSQNQALHKVMLGLLPDMSIREDGSIDIKRGIAKNPLTVTVYGSGTRGIANKIAKQLTDALYERLSDPAPLDEKFRAALSQLTGQNIPSRPAPEFTLSKDQVLALQNTVHELFAKPLRSAIESLMGDALTTAELVRQATQVQAIHFKYAFRQAVSDALNNRDGAPAEFLSQAEIQQIFQDLTKTHPLIDTGSQLIFVGGSAQADVETSEFGRDLGDKMKSPGYVFGPENPGVSGIPYLVIATGDGQMVLNLLTGKDPVTNTLPVFDGINMPLDRIEEQSQRINQAVYDGWMQNPVRSLANSFGKFISASQADRNLDISEEMRAELSEALAGKGKTGLSAEGVAAEISKLHELLGNTAEQIDARKAVLAKVNLSVDHMASAASPFVVSEKVELPADGVAASGELNKMLADQPVKGKPVSDKATVEENLAGRLDNVGTIDPTGTRVIERDELRGLVDKLDIPVAQRGLIHDAANALTTKGWTVLHGSPEQLRTYAQHNGLTVPAGLDSAHGLALPGDKLVYLVSPSAETLAHELVHAATIDRVYAYFAKDKALPAHVAEAMGRIEKLMDEFLTIDEDKLKGETLTQYAAAVAAIDEAGEQGSAVLSKTARINEFMAWTLSNQELAQLARQTKVQNKLALVAAKMVEAIKKLVGWRKGLSPAVGQDLFSNLRFNTLVVMQSKVQALGNIEDLSALAQFHAPKYGTSDRLSQLEGKLLDRMTEVLKSSEVNAEKLKDTQATMDFKAQRVVDSFRAAFPMTKQQESLFRTLVTAMGVDDRIDANAAGRAQDLYRHVLDNLKVEDFMANPASQDQGERYLAQQKYDLLTGAYFKGTDPKGRSTLLPAFIALAQTNDEFRRVLNNIGLPQIEKTGGGNLDNVLTDAGNQLMDWLDRYAAGEGNAKSFAGAVDALVDRMAESQVDREMYIDQFVNPVGDGINTFNAKIRDMTSDLAKTIGDKAEAIDNASSNKLVKLGAKAVQVASGIFDADRAGELAEGLLSFSNQAKMPVPLREFLDEIVGRTKSKAPIYDLINAFKAFSDKLRQEFREALPGQIAREFSRKLNPEEWTALYQGMAKTDLAVLKPLGSSRVLDLLKDASQISVEIARHEKQIDQLDAGYAALLKTKAQELARFMNTGEAGGNLLRNAQAIAMLNLELSSAERARRGKPSKGLVQAIDRLTTLYALDGLDASVRTAMAKLAATEKQGMNYLLGYLAGQREGERKKGPSDRGELNHYKGHTPTESKSATSLIVAYDAPNEKEGHLGYAELVRRGYTRVADYKGSAAEAGRPSMGYYFAPLSGRSPFNQGLAQNVRQTFHGVDAVSGYSLDTHGAGRITDRRMVERISRSIKANGQGAEPLLPVFDADGDVVAYERSVDPRQLARIEKETDLSRVLGIWRGRQAEEEAASALNRKLVEAAHDIWINRDKSRDDEFVNLLDFKSHKDKIYQDAVNQFSPQLMGMIRDVFGGEGFMVRKDMINDAIGFRSASVGDLWTGNTRLDPRVTEVAAKTAEAIFGRKAYQHLVTAESLIHNFVADAKRSIVVRSVIVPVSNIISNVYQLAGRGIPVLKIPGAMARKAAEAQFYHKSQLAKIQIEGRIRAAGNDPVKLRALRTELKSIEDSYKRLSIWPLIENGQLSSISDGARVDHDTTLVQGRLTDYMDRLASKLPESIRTAGRYAIISQDTALYQGLLKATEYGDFLAKAVMYDHLTQVKGMSQEGALAKITEEFVNYNRLAGRTRQMLESMGLTWFMNFKLRSIKVALNTLRENPVHGLLASLAPTPELFGSVGSVFKDNFLSMAVDRKLGYSMGPAMGMHAHSLNPWWNLLT